MDFGEFMGGTAKGWVVKTAPAAAFEKKEKRTVIRKKEIPGKIFLKKVFALVIPSLKIPAYL
jgi:hypothetical protein